jgi:hypothetical protein
MCDKTENESIKNLTKSKEQGISLFKWSVIGTRSEVCVLFQIVMSRLFHYVFL